MSRVSGGVSLRLIFTGGDAWLVSPNSKPYDEGQIVNVQVNPFSRV